MSNSEQPRFGIDAIITVSTGLPKPDVSGSLLPLQASAARDDGTPPGKPPLALDEFLSRAAVFPAVMSGGCRNLKGHRYAIAGR